MRHRVLSEMFLILASLVIAFVLWLIAKQGDRDTTWVTIPVRIEAIPPNMKIETLDEEISINVRFPTELRNGILSKNFRLVIDATNIFDGNPKNWAKPTEPKTEKYDLSRSMITKIGMDSAVEVIAVDPPSITLRGSFWMQTVKVVVPTTGVSPPDKVLVADPKPEPAEIKVTGSPQDLEQLIANNHTVKTEPIDLATLQNMGQLFRQLILPPGIAPLGLDSNLITVNIGLTEKPTQATINQVPVIVAAFDPKLIPRIKPEKIAVILSGPSSVLAGITADSLLVAPTKKLNEVANEPQEVALEARLKDTVPAETVRQVRVVECQPARITVEFVPTDLQNVGERPGTAKPGAAKPVK